MKNNDEFPLPQSEFVRLEFRRQNNTVYIELWNEERGDYEVPVSTQFGVIARLRCADDNDYYGLRIAVQGMDDERQSADILRRDLGSYGQAVKGRLLDLGMRFFNGGEKHVIAYLKAINPEDEIVVVSRRGWHWRPDPIFVAPNGEVFGKSKNAEIELENGTQTETQGNLDEWKGAIELAVNIDSVQHWQIAAAAAFAGTVAQLCQLETSGIHFSGMTSRGKTIALKLATSAWSNPLIGHGLLSLWRSTDNAFEASAAASNGTILALDELKLAHGKLVATTLFQLTSGTSKSRSNLEQTLRKRLQWITFVLSSGEQSLKEKVTSDGGKWIPGMSVRFSDVDVTEINSQVEKAVIDKIMLGIQKNYGVAGPAFCETLIAKGIHKDPDKLRHQIHEAANDLAGLNSDGSLLRAAMPFAVIQKAGQLAQSFGVLPNYDLVSAIQWAWNGYLTSSDAASLDPDQNCVDSLQNWIARNWDVSLKHFFGPHPNFREADGWYDDECIYILADRIVDAAGIGLKKAEIARILDRNGLLKRKDPDRKTFRRVPGMAHVTVYALDRSKMGPDPMEVVGGD
jgi:putative DNA primase/helicase